MNKQLYRIDGYLAWWFWPYMEALALFAFLTGAEPDEAKIDAITERALRVRFTPVDADVDL